MVRDLGSVAGWPVCRASHRCRWSPRRGALSVLLAGVHRRRRRRPSRPLRRAPTTAAAEAAHHPVPRRRRGYRPGLRGGGVVRCSARPGAARRPAPGTPRPTGSLNATAAGKITATDQAVPQPGAGDTDQHPHPRHGGGHGERAGPASGLRSRHGQPADRRRGCRAARLPDGVHMRGATSGASPWEPPGP